MIATERRLTRLVHVEPVWATVVSIHVIGASGEVGARSVAAMVGWLHHVDRTLSPFRRDSALCRMWRGELDVADRDELAEVLAYADRAARLTGGAFDPCWSGARPDPTGLVKGWAAQRCAELGMSFGLAGVQVNAGGDVCTRGVRSDGGPWRIGVEDPRDQRLPVAVVDGNDLHVATSGSSRRGAHIVGPGTPRGLQATVVGTNLTDADAYATALVAAPDARVLAAELDRLGWSSLLVEPNGTRHPSASWSDRATRQGEPA